MKRLVQYVSIGALVLGLIIAFYWWQAQNIASEVAKDQAEAAHGYGAGWVTPAIPVEDRALGMAFGFGLAFLGAFGLSASLRLPEPPLTEPVPTRDRIVL